MNQSENINELATALSKAQGEMQAAIKDSVNPFFKSKYADLGSIWDAARPALCAHGLCVIQSTEIVGEKVVLVTTLAHTSGQWVKSYLPLNPSKNDSQGMGSAITYLRRYSLSALVGVVCDEDDDGEASMGRKQSKAALQAPVPSIPVAPNIPDAQADLGPPISFDQYHYFLDLRKQIDVECAKNMMAHLVKTLGKDFKENEIPQSVYRTCILCMQNNIKMRDVNENT